MKITTARILARIFWYTVSGLAILLTLTCGGFTYWCQATSQGFIEGPGWERGEDIEYARSLDRTPPQWSPDGKLIVFSRNDAVYGVGSDGSGLRRITVEDEQKWIWNYDDGFEAAQSPSISPDGTRIAYAAYKHDRWWLPEIEDYQWDIVTARIDGSGRRRITRIGRSFSPAWSPDGTRIAFVSRGKLYTVAPDGSTIRSLAPDLPARSDSPVWSPGGRRLAFVVAEPASPDEKYPSDYSKNALYTMEADGSGLTRLGETGGLPSWSPDGGRIAFAKINGDTQAVVTMDPDGSNVRTVLQRGTLLVTRFGDVWLSPDGTRMLIAGALAPGLGESLSIVNIDGSDPRHLAGGGGGKVSWSPDGSHVAIQYPHDSGSRPAPFTMAVDEAAIAKLVREQTKEMERGWHQWDERERKLRAISLPAPSSIPSPAPATHSSRPVVDQRPPGTAASPSGGSPFGDRDILETLYHATGGPNWRDNTNWLSNEPLDAWYGVTTDGGGRVTKLILSENGLNSELPAELAALHELEVLLLGGNELSGQIPRELDSLSNLMWLSLGLNQLSGHIPPALGGLPNLEWLLLYGNALHGGIPAELGRLSRLTWLDLGSNQLSGKIPSELGSLSDLTELHLDDNLLDGEIPPKLTSLSNLRNLTLRGNRLSGRILPELSELAQLRVLDLRDNELSGRIPPEIITLNLARIHLDDNRLSGELPRGLAWSAPDVTFQNNPGLCAPACIDWKCPWERRAWNERSVDFCPSSPHPE